MSRWLLLLLLVPAAALADWPAWRGPDRTGVSTETGLLKAWPEDGPKLLWAASGVGGGYATPTVAGGRVYLLGSKAGDEYVHALDAKEGKPVYAVKLGKVGENKGPQYPGPRSSPTVAAGKLYTLGSDGDLVCLQSADGKLVWRHHLVTDFEGNRPPWAYCESPLLDGDVLVCTPGGPSAAMLGLDAATGKVRWKTPLDIGNVAGYASPVAARVGDRKVYVQFMGAAVVCVDGTTGELLWKYRKNVGGVNAATPIVHDGCVFTTAAGDAGAGGDALLKLVPGEKGVSVKQVYLSGNMKNFHGGVVRLGEYLYGTGSGGLVCLHFKTGDVKWRHRSIGSGSLMAADGHLYLRNTSGTVALVEATPDGYREHGRFAQPQRSRFATFAHPVVADGKLYLRDEDVLLCYDVRAK